MPDESVPARSTADLQSDLDRSRESAVRLLESLAQKLAAVRVVRTASTGLERAAHYVQVHRVKEMAAGIDRAARRRPAASILIAVIAGFLVGRAIRSR